MSLKKYSVNIYSYIIFGFATLLLVSQTFAVFTGEETSGSQTPPYIENEIIVKYQPEYAPQVLSTKVQERKEKRDSFFGSVSLIFDNLKYQFTSEEKPESRLARIQEADEDIGTTNKTRVFEADDIEQRSVYVIELDGTVTVEEAMKRYDQLPEVEYVEPNYVLTIQN